MHKSEVLSVFTFDIGALCFASGRSNGWVKKTCAQRETLTIAGFTLDEGKWDGIYVGRRKGDDLIYAGKVDIGGGPAEAAETADPRDAALRQADRPQGHLGRAQAFGRDRVPGEVGRRKGPAPVLKVSAGGSVMDVSTASGSGRTSVGNPMTIPAELHRAAMKLSPEHRRERAKMNEAAARVGRVDG